MNLFCLSVKTILAIASEIFSRLKIMLIFNIKADKGNTFVTLPEII
jgi:hypothetical protein